jgi:predicted esterase
MKTVVFIASMAAILLLEHSTSNGQQLAYESPAGTKFLLYTPPSYSTGSQTHPLLISLHSKGEVADDLTELTSKNPEQMPSRLIYINRWPAELPFIVLTPQLKPTEADPDPQWPAEYIDHLVRYVTANYRVDMNRIYLTGISRGGTGVWTYATAFPDKIAAMAPLAGRTEPITQACIVKNIPTWVFHGDADPTVPASASIDIVKAIYKCQPPGKFNPRLNVLHARGHNGWNEVYNGTNGYRIFEWLLKFTKNSELNTAPYVNAGVDRNVLMRNGPLYIRGDFFDSNGTIANVQWKQTAGTPLTLGNINSEFLTLTGLQAGTFEFELSATDNDGATTSDRVVLKIAGAISGPTVTGLVLMNGATNTDIGNITEGQIINKSDLNLTEINIRALATSDALSVRFSVNTDQNTRTLNSTAPLLIKAQATGPEWQIENGEYLICATPYSKGSATGTQGLSQCFKVTVTDNENRCEGTGEIRREEWTGVTGTNVSSIPVNTVPTSETQLAIFESPVNAGDNYGARIRGYVCPPFSGNYTFWIASNDKSELWLSTDAEPNHKVMIASVTGYTNSRQWTKSTTQQSVPINLVAGNIYYIEALHKEGTGSDNLSVGWQLPNGTLERPIPGKRLIPYQAPSNYSPIVNITNPTQGQTFLAPASIVISASASDSDGTINKVEFYHDAIKIGEDGVSPYSINWGSLEVGSYHLVAKAFDNEGASSTSSLTFLVSDVPVCSASGTIVREMWTGVTGATVSLIPVNTTPTSVSQLTIFEGPTNIGTNYGARIRGYICPPSTGNYVFWIASNDNSELWLSTDDNPLNKVRIASVTGYTTPRQWTKYPTQPSQAIPLVAGQRYYVEALHKQATGSDNLAVGWQLPNGTLERPIPATRLSPFDAALQTLISSYDGTPGDTGLNTLNRESEVFIYPNPMSSNEITIGVQESQDGSLQSSAFVEITSATGQKAFRAEISCSDCKEIKIRLDRNLTSGIYMVHGYFNGRKFTKRLVVL